ncbi:MAG: ABC transporter ATP-binding protein [Bacteroidota bacterium]
MEAFINIKSLTKSFGNSQKPVINDVHFSLKKGSITAIIGESGSGKTTLTRLISGLETPDTGTIELNATIVNNDSTFVPVEKRKVGMVFQDYALFPHLTVAQNVSYGISNKKDKKQRVLEVLQLVDLIGFEDRYPHQLSGGQQQRVALARALAPKPELLILDEPFSNLDVVLKLQLRNEIFHILKTEGVTSIFVTHDTQDAIAMADTIMVLKDGIIVQQGSVDTLYKQPNTSYVAALFNPIHIFSEEDLDFFNFKTNQNKTYAIRIDDFSTDEKADYTLKTKVVRSIFLGNHYVNTVTLPNNTTITFHSERLLNGETNIGFYKESLLEFDREK